MPVPQNPTIKIALTGLLALSFDPDRKNCQVGILQGILDHSLRFKVFKCTSSKKDPGSRELLLEINGEENNDDIILEVDKGDGTDTGIEFYSNGPFTRDETDDTQDFRWIVDIEGEEFHRGPLGVVPERLSPCFRVNDGLFYTGFLGLADVTQNGVPVNGLTETYVAVFTAANIYLAANGKATVRHGPDATESLVLENLQDTTYKVQVFNDCVRQIPIDTGGDFHFYYEAFRKRFDSANNINEAFSSTEQFSISGPLVPAEEGQGASRRHPCGPILAGKTSRF